LTDILTILQETLRTNSNNTCLEKRSNWFLANEDMVKEFEFLLSAIGELVVALNAVPLYKVRLFVHVRSQGALIESVPLVRLIKLYGYSRRWWAL